MPVLQYHLVASAYDEQALGTLLKDASTFYAASLYPEMDRPPVERVRAIIADIAPGLCATGGVQVSEGGAPAPFFTCLSLKGRPAEQLHAMMSGLSELTARALGCDLKLVRGQLVEIEPEHWYIAGNPASQARAAEISARAGG